jgi:hypothetical protein
MNPTAEAIPILEDPQPIKSAPRGQHVVGRLFCDSVDSGGLGPLHCAPSDHAAAAML